eukprot:TRINITY_DN9550_c0_g1_i2.p1 TRINITY_DN9550_c0_g1~~TRINITY_DN9550_c0_g1_i2.p1  ORF type:complete len:151 (+),score=5.72 TRINITY_DN9550_c0_g1_i2:346-798(+)
MSEVCEAPKFSADTLQKAIYLLDYVCSKELVPKDNLQLVCVASLTILAKFSEKDQEVPRMGSFQELCQYKYSLSFMRSAELTLLEKVGWDLNFSSLHQYIIFLISRGVVFSSEVTTLQEAQKSRLLRYLRKYCEYFSELSIQGKPFRLLL